MTMALHNKNANGDRFTSPLYSPTEAASIAGITRDKFRRWAFEHQNSYIAGHTAEERCEEYSVPVEHIEDAVRVHLRKAA